jgi:hypothetical protein
MVVMLVHSLLGILFSNSAIIESPVIDTLAAVFTHHFDLAWPIVLESEQKVQQSFLLGQLKPFTVSFKNVHSLPNKFNERFVKDIFPLKKKIPLDIDFPSRSEAYLNITTKLFFILRLSNHFPSGVFKMRVREWGTQTLQFMASPILVSFIMDDIWDEKEFYIKNDGLLDDYMYDKGFKWQNEQFMGIPDIQTQNSVVLIYRSF